MPRAVEPAGRWGTSRTAPLGAIEKSRSQRGRRRLRLRTLKVSVAGRPAKRSSGAASATSSRRRFQRDTTPDTASSASIEASTR